MGPDDASDPAPAAARAPFPQTKVRAIMKVDRDVGAVTPDAVAAVAYATEAFVQHLAAASYEATKETGRKTIAYADVGEYLVTAVFMGIDVKQHGAAQCFPALQKRFSPSFARTTQPNPRPVYLLLFRHPTAPERLAFGRAWARART